MKLELILFIYIAKQLYVVVNALMDLLLLVNLYYKNVLSIHE